MNYFSLGREPGYWRAPVTQRNHKSFVLLGEEFSQPRKHVLTCIRDSHAGKSMQKWQCIRGGRDGLAHAQADLKCLYVFLPISAVMFPRGMHTQTPYTIVITFLVLTSGFSSLFLICGWHGRIEGGDLKIQFCTFRGTSLYKPTSATTTHFLGRESWVSGDTSRRLHCCLLICTGEFHISCSSITSLPKLSVRKTKKPNLPFSFFSLSLFPFLFCLSILLSPFPPPPPPASGVSPTKD